MYQTATEQEDEIRQTFIVVMYHIVDALVLRYSDWF
jgi:hypothetical protein